jgi:hypothetical protein
MIGYPPGGSAEAGVRPLARTLEPLLGQSRAIVQPNSRLLTDALRLRLCRPRRAAKPGRWASNDT